jgi:RHS repeat-associated protein
MVQSGWVGASGPLTEFDYAYDPQRRRQSAQQSGLAFNDYYSPGTGYGAVSTYYQYDSLSEVQTAATYRGAAVATGSPASTDELPGRRFEYRYDNSGNRTVSGPADPSGPASSIDDTYTLNSLGLNQYIDRQNNTVRVLGNAAAGSTVTVPGASVGQLDRNYGATLVPANQSGPAQGTITVSAVVQVSGINYSQSLSPRNYTVPAQTQQFAYDADGNLTSDGMWTYIYDGENRLIETTSSLPASQGFTRLDLKFKYDYLNRRIEKQVFNIDVNPTQATLDHKYIYDGWNLIAETDASGNLLRSYTWGLDVTGSLTSSGGVGALLAITNVSGGTATNYFTAYDGNGNLAALVNSAGGATTPDLAAVYEFAPFGEPLRAEVFDTNIQDNAFRFSSKYTDSETGLAYYGKRYYSPSLGRFINRDPAEEAGGLNLYGFCGNNAINRFDVLGNMTSGDMFLRAAWEDLLDYVQYDLGSDTTNSYGSDADRDSRMDRPSEESLQEQAEQKGVVAQQAQANTADQKEDVNVFKAVFELGKNLVKTVEAALGNSKGGGGPNGQTSGPNSEISPNENAKNALPDNAFTEYSSKILKSDTQFAKLAGRLAGNDWAGWKALWELGKMPRDDGGLFTGKYYEDALLGYIDPNSNGVITTRRGSEGQLLHADVPLTQYGRDGGMHMDLSISPKNLVFWAHTHDDDLAPTYPNDASSNYKGINAWSIVISKQRLFFLSPDFKYDMDKEKTTSGSAYFMYLEKLRNGGYSDGK